MNHTNRYPNLVSNRIIKNTIWIYLGFTFNLLFGFIITPFFIHTLGPDAYGIYSIVAIIIGYASLLDLGIGASIVKLISEYNTKRSYEEINHVVSTAFILYFILGSIGFIILYIFTNYFISSIFNIPENLISQAKMAFIITQITFFYNFVFGLFSNIITGLQRYDISSKIQIIMRIFSSIVSILVLIMGYGLVEFVGAIALSGVIGITINIIIAKRLMPKLSIKYKYFNLNYISSILRFSLVIFIGCISGRIIFDIDKILIGALLPIEDVTIYAIGAMLAVLVFQIPSQISPMLLPASSELYAKDDIFAVRELILRGTKFAVTISTPIAIILFVSAQSIVELWVGPGFEMSAYISKILIVGFYVNTFTHALTPVLIGTGKIKISLYYYIASIILNISSSLILTMKLGVIGAPLGTSITMVFIWTIFTIHVSKIYGINIKELTYRLRFVAIAGLILFIMIYSIKDFLLHNELVINLTLNLIAVGIYLIVIIFGFDNYEKELFYKFIRQYNIWGSYSHV